MKKILTSKETYALAVKANEKYVNIETIKRNYDSEIVQIVKKIRSRVKNNPLSTKHWCDNLITKRLKTIAEALPDECYSMGSHVTVYYKQFRYCDDRTNEYSNGCKFKATHGSVNLNLTKDQFLHTKVIANLVTYIYPNQKTKVKECYWYSGFGRKNTFELMAIQGYVYANYHSTDKELAKLGGERNIERAKLQKKQVENFNKALRLQYGFQDSIDAGNCEAGTRAFIMRLHLNENKKYRGKYLLEAAKEKSQQSVYYVERMIYHKAKR